MTKLRKQTHLYAKLPHMLFAGLVLVSIVKNWVHVTEVLKMLPSAALAAAESSNIFTIEPLS